MAFNPRALAHRWFEEVWNQGREHVIDELLPADAVGYGLGEGNKEAHGAADFKIFWRNLRTALPDVNIRIDDMIVEGDKAAVRVTLAGTHQGQGLGVEPSGKRVAISGVVIIRERDGQMLEAWNSWDQLGLLQQIGVIHLEPPATRFVSAQA